MEYTDYDREDARLLLANMSGDMSGRERDVCERIADGAMPGTAPLAEAGEENGGGLTSEDLGDTQIFENFRRQYISELADLRKGGAA